MSEAPRLTLDPDTPGVSRGHLVVTGGSDLGELWLPIFSVNKGVGPRLLFTGRNHGDELEGPIVARRLIDWLTEAQSYGSVIVVPVLNPLAVQASSRNTPLDGLNLNRVFRGCAGGSVTEQLADAVSRILFPMADTVFDLHSFGLRWDLPPAANNAPDCRETARMFGIVAQHQGKVFVCAEFGGSTIGANDLAIDEARVRNAIIALGLVEGKAEYPTFREQKSGQTLETHPSDELKSPAPGNFEPRHSVFDVVEQGDVIGIPHSPRAGHSIRLVQPAQRFSVSARRSQCTLMQ
ncbi:succinylglutamate desuccinylase/aspartoacylase family protein [Mesorhizobium sp. M0488]|uniref:succinylglutamate desuccinylase/aspartoacylase domain-containing protein n=1 Tax=unclassified Mesorhizobium TaxID=325217 RepID=UPI00333D8A00